MDESFRARYGPWAVVAGASDGVGAALARRLAAAGVHVVLLARRQALLDEVAASIRATAGTQARAVAIDLAAGDAMDRVVAATSDIEVGFMAYCAGADANYEPFLANPVDTALAMIHRNCAVPVQMCHHFAGPMAERGHGGIVLVGSGAGLVGAPNMVTYAATKAFDMVLGEALWAELHTQGVDVLSLVLGSTDTPALRRLLARRGLLDGPDDPSPIPGATSAEDVADEAIANLANGPTWFVGDQLRDGARQLGAIPRGDAVRLMIQMGSATMGTSQQVEA
ncbi:SDR family NAD(P)-dependent oxidoreductase [Frankia sp. CNm7]|uniref:SDR family NAD(P)-dependent oxidoreductase n=1 Tax=Frankia nepalensis TaxID=1836974 RepID=A0A937RKZ0_9ACTN|nr:SDR family NAD(P)-dependent oxidoreductase [Frankia nepalensis]MBL7509058.1 SDR family NAD(P)-dependent oxidoreductase [Frankia nepalensis]MBL7516839.1 SDR family NAD(P)-dependent oxidoreductase [Frankia nepalensis]MBL7627836.1 SDR family NAD(P)-dependent oxidoreductase [Frankia nepalensis]